jgi:hypothetical protein
MASLRIGFRFGLLIALGIEIMLAPVVAQDNAAPKEQKPATPGSRVLTGEDATRAKALDEAIAKVLTEDRWGDAIARADELLALRSQAQGPKHFETVTAEWHLKTLHRVASKQEKDRIAYRSISTMNDQAASLHAQGEIRPGPTAVREGD